jgi:hypothetical protein
MWGVTLDCDHDAAERTIGEKSMLVSYVMCLFVNAALLLARSFQLNARRGAFADFALTTLCKQTFRRSLPTCDRSSRITLYVAE